ncbi:carboxypeptidase-like regulatory domain-containing protein [uncultured Flavobacterium sp.]|uniref:carboxypeptidase-like regulatory domain-containing protein n=1 Tax=uncultured Flavobacterium sp. TaxID=165435 RepID=UPI0030EB312A
MNQRLDLTIEKPCSENFKEFISTGKGGFCNSCNKEVIDFSIMNDAEIVKYFNSNKEKTCGNFRKDQLKIYLDYQPSYLNNKFNFLNKSVLGFSIVSLLSFNYGFTQDKKLDSTFHKSQNYDLNKKKSDTIIKPMKIIVKGKVSDELGPLAGASVVIKNTIIGVTTDFDGNFVFKEPIDKDAILILSFVGFKKVEFKASEANDITLLSSMESCDFIMMGEVSTNKVYKSNCTFLQKISGFFKND